MARQREFDETKVIETAINLFWKKGYNAVSTQDMLEAFNISRSSMYSAYKTKRNLFILALQEYRNTSAEKMITTLNEGTSFKATIKKILSQFIEETISDIDNKGCFIVNTAIELAAHDDEILEIIREHRKDIISALTNAIEKGINKGEIVTKQSPISIANYFYSFINGLRVDGKIYKDVNEHMKVLDIVMSLLDN
ncbi:TetR/AcrR family transcriptional regulator [Flavobacterium sp. J27]|uniref:TetR/AcrR family transcriptional regulator n=1 Tax=Flavobacterium sp. J27 TaxID=2060419 RepID=UPI00103179F5|nr:TetR/AcrR family transcriptional regulator [Flavobacterium sp. J27]